MRVVSPHPAPVFLPGDREGAVDRVRARLPQDEDGKLPRSAIVTMVVMAVVAMTASIWFTLLR